jgi:hypothetical protein
MYSYYNANYRGNFVNDCVIRAISVAENTTWEDTYDDLSKIARRNGILLDDVEFVDPLLNYRYCKIPLLRTDTTVGDFVTSHPTGIYLITMPGHITVLKDGVIYDTFDCRDRKIKDVWKVF